MTTRHEFLAQLHLLLQPKEYLEVGVQHGYSLNLAHAARVAIGIDPEPLVGPQGNQFIFRMKSHDFFTNPPDWFSVNRVDLAFIDGSHLFEDALQDFIHIARLAHADTVVVFDDVLPYNQAIAAREQPAGDWTGDVWKVAYSGVLDGLSWALVDVFPTGALMVWGFENWAPWVDTDRLLPDTPVPDEIISRSTALQPQQALEVLSQYLFTREW